MILQRKLAYVVYALPQLEKKKSKLDPRIGDSSVLLKEILGSSRDGSVVMNTIRFHEDAGLIPHPCSVG